MDVLAQMGWKSVSFDGFEIKDFEEPLEELPVFVEVGGELDIDQSSVKITFSTDNFATSETVSLAYNNNTQQFEGDLPLNKAEGKIYYYYEAKTTANVAYSYPERAPEQKLSFRIGDDYYPPVLQHNPEKLVNANSPVMNFAAVANDNVGINRVEVQYRINGQDQSPSFYQKRVPIITPANSNFLHNYLATMLWNIALWLSTIHCARTSAVCQPVVITTFQYLKQKKL